MNLYLVTRKDRCDWDEYDSVVVCADSYTEAANTSPCFNQDYKPRYWNSNNLEVSLLGTANESIKKGIVLSSFRAG